MGDGSVTDFCGGGVLTLRRRFETDAGSKVTVTVLALDVETGAGAGTGTGTGTGTGAGACTGLDVDRFSGSGF